MKKSTEMLMTMSLVASVYEEPARRAVKICTRAYGNNMKDGKKCKHSGSCDGTKRCRFAIY